jgi:hypothetical protein
VIENEEKRINGQRFSRSDKPEPAPGFTDTSDRRGWLFQGFYMYSFGDGNDQSPTGE